MVDWASPKLDVVFGEGKGVDAREYACEKGRPSHPCMNSAVPSVVTRYKPTHSQETSMLA